MWAVGAIVVLVLVLVACFIFCIFKKCFGKKKKPKKAREGKTGRRRKAKEGEGEGGEKVNHYRISSNLLFYIPDPKSFSLMFYLAGWGDEEGRGGRGERPGEAR